MDNFAFGIITCIVLSIVLTRFWITYFGRVVVSRECGRSLHSGVRPTGGGVGFLLAWGVVMALLPLSGEQFSPWTYLLCVPLGLVGLVDDLKDLPMPPRLLTQLCVAGLAVSFNAWALPGVGTFWVCLTWVFFFVFLVGCINLYNFMDGSDGLLGGTAMVQLFFLYMWTSSQPLALLGASLLGFLFWNRCPARVFMGDVGSTCLGLAVGMGVLFADSDRIPNFTALIFLLPLLGDAVYTLASRLRYGMNIFKAHRMHVYQRLGIAGWSHDRISAMYAGMTLAAGLLLTWNPMLGGWLVVVLWLAWLAWVKAYLNRRGCGFRELFVDPR